MNLRRKKELAAKALKVGKGRIAFNKENLSEIKEAITKQDILGLKQEGAISIKPIKGRKTVQKRKTRRGPGKIKKTIRNRKQVYVKITRKLRVYLMQLRDKGAVERELYWTLRKKIRMRDFKSLANFKEYLKKIDIDLTKVVISKKPKAKKTIKKETKNVEKTKGDKK
jgi:large subunit ribosomal protein L19e